MRILFARLLVIVTGVMVVTLAIVFAAIRNPSPAPPGTGIEEGASTEAGVARPGGDSGDSGDQAPEARAITRGRAVWAEQRCQMCHSIGGEGNTRSPLDGVGGRLTEREIRLWITAPREMNPAVAKRAYQLSKEDLDALVAYLLARR